MAATETMTNESGHKLATEKISDGSITCVRFIGILDEAFDGAQLAATIRAATLILDLGQVQKISSFGIREWSDFIRGIERSAENIYITECSPKVIDQINMVAGFAGKALIYSFYAPYRCDYCDTDSRTLFQVDRDEEAVRAGKPRETSCESCGRDMYFDEDPATYFAYVASQPKFKVADDVLDFLSNRLGYRVAGTDRGFKVDKWIDGKHTYLRLGGRLDGSFPSKKLAEGLEGVVVVDVAGVGMIDLAGAAEWRNFVTTAAERAESVSLLDCSPVFLEKLSAARDFGDQVLTLNLPYSCSSCGTTASQYISVTEHHSVLQFATPPEMKCVSCGKADTTCVASTTVLSRLRELPQPTLNGALKSFVKNARKRSFEREHVVASAEPLPNKSGITSLLAAGIFLAMVAIAVVLVMKLNKDSAKSARENSALRNLEEKMATVASAQSEQAPPWVIAKTPQYASCTDLINRITCLGISPYTTDKELGGELARDAAIEEMVNAIGIKIDDSTFNGLVRPLYAQTRLAAFMSYDEIQGDRRSDAYAKAEAAVQSARRRARESALASSGGIVPLQPSDTYWEEYKSEEEGGANEFLVFVTYEINMDAVKRLMELWTTPRAVAGGEAMTAFPLLAWRLRDFSGGVVVTKSAGRLKELGAEDNAVVTQVGEIKVNSVAELLDGVGKSNSIEQLTASPDEN